MNLTGEGKDSSENDCVGMPTKVVKDCKLIKIISQRIAVAYFIY